MSVRLGGIMKILLLSLFLITSVSTFASEDEGFIDVIANSVDKKTSLKGFISYGITPNKDVTPDFIHISGEAAQYIWGSAVQEGHSPKEYTEISPLSGKEVTLLELNYRGWLCNRYTSFNDLRDRFGTIVYKFITGVRGEIVCQRPLFNE